ncbi:CpaF family protein [Clostridium sp. 19966]|uniref:CpaF family protein n=1 Tax=Clostridium sp. 19966 TaxID=2768166 RepID=UPI0028DEC8D8|nr:CpaF family protein [Clostridium sp. 19966]MDT8718567.1 CpaF family protein [Clostridium sp. 19966]
MDDEARQTIIEEVKSSIQDDKYLRKDMEEEELWELIKEEVFARLKRKNLSIMEKKEIIVQIFNAIKKLDVLQPLIDDKTVTEIMINGPENIFIEKNGAIQKVDMVFENRKKLEDIIYKIVSDVNRVVNESSPIVDARLKDGSRVNVVLPPIALNGPIVTIRKFPENPITIEDLVSWGALTEETAEFLRLLVEAKYNIFISGGTGSGKTTMLNALSNFIPHDERVITIEDSAELQIKTIENLVSLETRNVNTEGKGEITIRDLIKSSLRMRPDRIVVGEVRGAEALDMLQAMNTGHDGSLSTGHANSTADMLSRLETMVLTGALLPLEAIKQQIASALDIIVHLSRLRDKSRKVVEITEVSGFQNGEIILNPLYEFEESSQSQLRKVEGVLKRTNNPMKNLDKFVHAGITPKI